MRNDGHEGQITLDPTTFPETTTPMRIAIVTPPWLPVPPLRYGGTEQVVDALARGLYADGHEVLLFATGDSTCAVPVAWALPRARGTEELDVATELAHVIHAYNIARAWGADVIHDHTLCGPAYARRDGIPIVATNHGPFEHELATLYRAVSEEVAVVAISHAQAAAATSTRIAAVIHHGIDVDSLPMGRGDGGYSLFLGRMCPTKGVDIAVRVARASGIPLVIAAKMAEPAERRYFEREVAPLLGAGVEYVGEVDTSQKRRLLAGARCLLNPIRWPEPFGMVMIEALAAGTPIVATPCGSVPEIVKEGVTGFVRASPRDLAAAVVAVDRLDRDACRAAAATRFSTMRMVRDHVRVYETVLDAGVTAA